jgi:hypothetical protein
MWESSELGIPVLRDDRNQTRLGPGEGIVPPSPLVAIEMQPSSRASTSARRRICWA